MNFVIYEIPDNEAMVICDVILTNDTEPVVTSLIVISDNVIVEVVTPIVAAI